MPKPRTIRLILIGLAGAGVVGWAVFGPGFVLNRYERPAGLMFPPDRANFVQMVSPLLFDAGLPGLALDGIVSQPAEDGDAWLLTRPTAAKTHRAFTRVTRNDDPDDPWALELSSGDRLTLDYVRIGYRTSLDSERFQKFKPGEAEPFEDVEEGHKVDSAREAELDVWLQFVGEGPATYHKQFHGAWDGETFAKVTGSWGSGGGGDGFHHEIDTLHWHDGPLVFIFDVASGEPVEVEIEPSASQQLLDLGNGMKLRLAHVASGQVRSLKIERGPADETTRFEFSGEGTSLLLALSNPENGFGVDIEALDEAGEVLTFARGIFHLAPVTYVNLGTELGKIHRLRIRSYPNFDRIVFTLPRVPGLPESNRGLANLFDARVPYFRPEADYDLALQIRKMTQLDMSSSAEFPPGYFPVEFKDASVHEMLTQFDRYTPGPPLTANLATGMIEPAPEPGWKQQLLDWWAAARDKLGL